MGRIILAVVAVVAVLGYGAYHFRFALLSFMVTPSGRFDAAHVPPAPDYDDPDAWLALPDRADSADLVPKGAVPGDNQDHAPVDAFYVHPTTYVDAAGWNAPFDDPDAGRLAGELGQAAVFNGCCRVYGPRYRQATLAAFQDESREDGRKALGVAYDDVLAAFRHYLAHWGGDRPFILVAHSQGTLHLQRLLAEVVAPDADLRRRLVAAYAVGYPLPVELFDGVLAPLRPCRAPGATGCVLAWSSFARDGAPDFYRHRAEIWDPKRDTGFAPVAGRPILCVNPVSFTMDEAEIPREANRGGTVRSMVTGELEPLSTALVDTRCHDGILRISEPEPYVFRAILLPGGDYHVYDYALFWQDIRLDAIARVNAYLRRGTPAPSPMPEAAGEVP
ncbi:DUF3089 domain-containing protein [Zavarzinia compransoris]|uniref:DUF3089 domain-containing protein n=1 Tax=Zavarzinia marina TaxID=2911065 RepID=UPI001F25A774|nr:DUF3089 domain-containing protein [Zavarzinia marina]MCF4167231.1 DUF3089 domain-containing protein [Zavarzinia marina]